MMGINLEEQLIIMYYVIKHLLVLNIKKMISINLEEQLIIKYYMIKHLMFLSIQKNDGYQRGLASMVYNFVDINSAMRADNIASTHTGTATNSEYQQIKETLH